YRMPTRALPASTRKKWARQHRIDDSTKPIGGSRIRYFGIVIIERGRRALKSLADLGRAINRRFRIRGQLSFDRTELLGFRGLRISASRTSSDEGDGLADHILGQLKRRTNFPSDRHPKHSTDTRRQNCGPDP